MQVITLNPEEFDANAGRLAKKVEQGASNHFDAIVGVRRGGSVVCDAFLRHFPRERFGERFDVSLQRPSTKRKEGWLGRLLKRLPYPVLDAMRMAESRFLRTLRKWGKPGPMPSIELPEGLEAILHDSKNPGILIIDDAIDSGDTLSAIITTLRHRNPDAAVSTAVMTETTPDPCIRADYTLYRNRTLIRFPWSNDYKNL